MLMAVLTMGHSILHAVTFTPRKLLGDVGTELFMLGPIWAVHAREPACVIFNSYCTSGLTGNENKADLT